jgi:hypothetical protein
MKPQLPGAGLSGRFRGQRNSAGAHSNDADAPLAAQDAKEKQVQDELLAYSKSAGANLPTAYAVAAIPARSAVERNDW